VYEADESGVWISGAKLASAEAVYRDAFPAYKVFVYYHDVTEDVVEVRTNQSGGSAERSAGSASITLVNPFDRYMLTHTDMAIIGAEQAKINDRMNNLAISKSEDSIWEFRWLRDTIETLVAAGNYNALVDYLEMLGLNPEDFILVPDPDSFVQTEVLNKEALRAAVLEKGQYILENDPLSFFNMLGREQHTAKGDILGRKLTYKTKMVYDKNSPLISYEPQVIFNYPFQEGDSIFHSNDPVRIALRDPFDARVWYWGFSGFVDTWTENEGPNKDSLLTLTCTDVTKMARYSYTQINTGILDDQLNQDGDAGDASSHLILYFKEIFKDFAINEVLEILFFGTDTIEKNFDVLTRNFVSTLSNAEARSYLLQNFGSVFVEDLELNAGISDFTDPELQKQIRNSPGLQKQTRQIIFTRERKSRIGKLPQYKNVAKISHPLGLNFKRKNDKWGVYTYFYGEPDEVDAEIGEAIKDLKTWNEVIHHRVRRSDLKTMAIDDEGIDLDSTAFLESIIWAIGTNQDGMGNPGLGPYPVGCGRVFFFTAAELKKQLGKDAIDRSFGGVGSMHSEFVDDLTLLYDLAENIEYYFYATPKGDVVFEMPFYDFDATDFAGDQDLTEHDFDVSELINEYEALFREAYAGAYDDQELIELTNMQFKVTAQGTNFEVNDYTKIPVFDYLEHFTIEPHEQYSFTNSSSDTGVCTVARSSPKYLKSIAALDTMERRHALVKQQDLIPLLGKRVLSAGMPGYITDYERAAAYLGNYLNRVNSEARTVSVSTVPKFGLMVNRPARWRKKKYSANISSIQNSIVWNSNCDTTVNMNQIRGWTGEVDPYTGANIMKHFGGNRPYDLSKILGLNTAGIKDEK
jgi:hypothetical protein